MRDKIDEFGGFEVKTEGDAFMVAFEDVTSAVRFGLIIQEVALHLYLLLFETGHSKYYFIRIAVPIIFFSQVLQELLSVDWPQEIYDHEDAAIGLLVHTMHE